MDPEHVAFKDLLRSLAASSTRRSIARAVAGLTLLWPLSALLNPEDTEAKKKKRRKKKKKCKGGTKKCGKKCIPATNCCTDANCGGGGATCHSGSCACPAGEKDCQGTCIPEDDCCPACPSGKTCDGGECVCQPGTHPCGNSCVTGEQCCDGADCGAGGGFVCDDGNCLCPGESLACDAQCCDPGAGEVCHLPAGVCQSGGCPPSNFCVRGDRFACDGEQCSCITSVEGETACSDFFFINCTDCTSDLQCATAMGLDALCIPHGEWCVNCIGTASFCVATGCSSSPLRTNGRGGRRRAGKLRFAK